VKVDLPALTDKDRADVAVGCEVGVDFYALSFVRAGRRACPARPARAA